MTWPHTPQLTCSQPGLTESWLIWSALLQALPGEAGRDSLRAPELQCGGTGCHDALYFTYLAMPSGWVSPPRETHKWCVHVQANQEGRLNRSQEGGVSTAVDDQKRF